MSNRHLYTVVVDVYETQEVFIDQIHTKTTKIDDVLYAWVEQAVKRGFIKGTDDPQIAFKDVIEFDKRLKLLENVFNAWRIEFILGKDFYIQDVIRASNDEIFDLREAIHVTLDFIKTATSKSSMRLSAERPLEASDARFVRHAEEKHATYLERHECLKGVAALTKSITQERRRVEKQLLYWDAKRRFFRQDCNRDINSKEEYVYTIIFNYEYYNNSGVWVYQDPEVGTDINYIFCDWVYRFLYDTWRPDADSDYRERIITDSDRLILMNKASSGHYTPTPVENCTNVWSTYFSLSEGMVKLTIIKTALDEVA